MNSSQVLAAMFMAVTSCTQAQANEHLLGTWRLVAFRAEVVETGQNIENFGKAPEGYLTYSRDGHMLVVMVKENRPKRADLKEMTDAERITLFNSLIAYGGTFQVNGDRITHNVDISWNENWTGTAQVRQFRIDGRRLTLTQAPQVGPDGRRATAVLVWERVQ